MPRSDEATEEILQITHVQEDRYSVAGYSPCMQYRYFLVRRWGAKRAVKSERVAFIGLNPSTATESRNDPTVRRCIGYALQWGFREFVMLNAFAYRSTDPKRLRSVADPVGPANDDQIRIWTRKSSLVVCCWGTHARYLDRDSDLRCRLQGWGVPMTCLGRTKGGLPRHPLYLRTDTPVIDL